jgi:predicted methyltransferase MtxX (methanogen marker protein 4)
MEQSKLNKDWERVNAQIERSKIKRYPWKKIFGESLTHAIIRRKIKGMTSDQVYHELRCSENLCEFLSGLGLDEGEKVESNLRISVSARFAENNQALKTYREERWQ